MKTYIIIILLISYPAIVNAQMISSEIFTIVEEGKIEEAKACIASGVNVNASDSNENTALFYALLSGKQEMVALIIQAGADVNAKNYWGKTPLLVALEKGCSPDIVEMLIQNGAAVNIVDNNGTTALYEALAQSVALAKTLVNAGATFTYHQENSGYDMLYANSEELIAADKITFAVQNGLDLNVVYGDYDFTALHHAIGTGDVELVKLMIDNGANVNAQNSLGETPLHEAIMQARPGDSQAEIVALLLGTGADPYITNNSGNTAVDQAIAWELEAIVSVFAEAGIPVNKSNK